MEFMHVRPAPGCRVRMENRRELMPEHGARVPKSQYWLRRLKAGEVEPIEPKPERKPRAEKE